MSTANPAPPPPPPPANATDWHAVASRLYCLTDMAKALLGRGDRARTAGAAEGVGRLLSECTQRLEALVVRLVEVAGSGSGEVVVDGQAGKVGRTALWLASFHEQTHLVASLLDAGASVDTVRTSKDLDRRDAARMDYPNRTQHKCLRLQRGPERLENVEGDDNGVTPLYVAARSGRLDIVAPLIDAGADVTFRRPLGRGETVVYIAAGSGDTAVVEQLVAAGADVNIPCRGDGYTPLMAACSKRHESTALALLRHGASIDASDGRDETHTAFGVACWRGLTAVVTEMLASHNPSASNLVRGACEAALSGHCDILRALLIAGADVDAVNPDDAYVSDSFGRTPLNVAAAHGHVAAVELLLAARVTVDSQCSAGVTPLWWAAEGGHATVVRVLAAAGADVNYPIPDDLEDNDMPAGATPLLMAAAQGYWETVQALIECGADVDHVVPTRLNTTALGSLPLVPHADWRAFPLVGESLLLQHGADPFARPPGADIERGVMEIAEGEDAVTLLLDSRPSVT